MKFSRIFLGIFLALSIFVVSASPAYADLCAAKAVAVGSEHRNSGNGCYYVCQGDATWSGPTRCDGNGNGEFQGDANKVDPTAAYNEAQRIAQEAADFQANNQSSTGTATVAVSSGPLGALGASCDPNLGTYHSVDNGGQCCRGGVYECKSDFCNTNGSASNVVGFCYDQPPTQYSSALSDNSQWSDADNFSSIADLSRVDLVDDMYRRCFYNSETMSEGTLSIECVNQLRSAEEVFAQANNTTLQETQAYLNWRRAQQSAYQQAVYQESLVRVTCNTVVSQDGQRCEDLRQEAQQRVDDAKSNLDALKSAYPDPNNVRILSEIENEATEYRKRTLVQVNDRLSVITNTQNSQSTVQSIIDNCQEAPARDVCVRTQLQVQMGVNFDSEGKIVDADDSPFCQFFDVTNRSSDESSLFCGTVSRSDIVKNAIDSLESRSNLYISVTNDGTVSFSQASKSLTQNDNQAPSAGAVENSSNPVPVIQEDEDDNDGHLCAGGFEPYNGDCIPENSIKLNPQAQNICNRRDDLGSYGEPACFFLDQSIDEFVYGCDTGYTVTRMRDTYICTSSPTDCPVGQELRTVEGDVLECVPVIQEDEDDNDGQLCADGLYFYNGECVPVSQEDDEFTAVNVDAGAITSTSDNSGKTLVAEILNEQRENPEQLEEVSNQIFQCDSRPSLVSYNSEFSLYERCQISTNNGVRYVCPSGSYIEGNYCQVDFDVTLAGPNRDDYERYISAQAQYESCMASSQANIRGEGCVRAYDGGRDCAGNLVYSFENSRCESRVDSGAAAQILANISPIVKQISKAAQNISTLGVCSVSPNSDACYRDQCFDSTFGIETRITCSYGNRTYCPTGYQYNSDRDSCIRLDFLDLYEMVDESQTDNTQDLEATEQLVSSAPQEINLYADTPTNRMNERINAINDCMKYDNYGSADQDPCVSPGYLGEDVNTFEYYVYVCDWGFVERDGRCQENTLLSDLQTQSAGYELAQIGVNQSLYPTSIQLLLVQREVERERKQRFCNTVAGFGGAGELPCVYESQYGAGRVVLCDRNHIYNQSKNTCELDEDVVEATSIFTQAIESIGSFIQPITRLVSGSVETTESFDNEFLNLEVSPFDSVSGVNALPRPVLGDTISSYHLGMTYPEFVTADVADIESRINALGIPECSTAVRRIIPNGMPEDTSRECYSFKDRVDSFGLYRECRFAWNYDDERCLTQAEFNSGSFSESIIPPQNRNSGASLPVTAVPTAEVQPVGRQCGSVITQGIICHDCSLSSGDCESEFQSTANSVVVYRCLLSDPASCEVYCGDGTGRDCEYNVSDFDAYPSGPLLRADGYVYTQNRP